LLKEGFFMPEFLTTIEAAAIARTSRQNIRKWILAGALPASRPGKRRILISRADLERFIESRKVQTSTEEAGR